MAKDMGRPDRDAANRRWTDEELRQLATFPQENPNPVLRVDLEGALLYVNDAGRDMLEAMGAASEHPLPQPVLDLVGQARHADNVIETELPDGRGRVLWLTAVHPDGEPYVNLYVRDITDRKQTEEALRQSREDLGRAQAVGNMGWWRLDTRANVLTWSDENYRIFGLPPGTPLSYETFLNCVHPDDRQYVDTQWQAALRGEPPYDIEHRIVAEGHVKWVREKAYLEFDPQGRLLGGFGITQDITDRKRAEEHLRRTARELERSNSDLQQFAYVASHDLQEPLRMVTSFMGLLRDRYQGRLDAKADEYIDHAVDGARRMSRLIEDLLAYSRVQGRREKAEPVSVEAAFREATARLRSAIEEAQAEITHDELPTVLANGAQVTQLLQNLLGNALKFRALDRPCKVHASACPDGPWWLLSVRDNGIGIAQKHLDRVFDIFQRLHSRAKYPGTGIGLAICRRIVERHGGKIWVDSRVGEGSTFYCTLPAGTSG